MTALTRLFLLMLAIVLNSCSPQGFWIQDTGGLAKINIIDQNGLSETYSNADRLKQYENVDFLGNQPYQKVMRIYGKDVEGKSHALITSYYPNGQIQQYLEVVDNRALGTYKEWYQTGTLKLTAKIVGGMADINTNAEKTWLFDGCAKVWNEEGELHAEILYAKGQLHGESRYYHSNGNLWKKMHYKDDRLEGTNEIFLENGDLMQQIPYVNGKKEGCAQRFWSTDLLAAEEIYCEDFLTHAKYFDKSGMEIGSIEEGSGQRIVFNKESIFERQQYQMGLLDGKIEKFDDKGVLVSTYHMRNNLKHGEEIEFYPPLYSSQKVHPLLSIQWYEGKIQGVCRTWYQNGKLESQREMSNNKKNGLCLAYYLDGNVMLIEEYEHDKLVKGKYFKKGEKRPVSQVSDGTGLVTMHDAEGNYVNKFSYEKGIPAKI